MPLPGFVMVARSSSMHRPSSSQQQRRPTLSDLLHSQIFLTVSVAPLLVVALAYLTPVSRGLSDFLQSQGWSELAHIDYAGSNLSLTTAGVYSRHISSLTLLGDEFSGVVVFMKLSAILVGSQQIRGCVVGALCLPLVQIFM